MINTYSTDSKGAKSKTDQRRAERERQINIMDSLISDFEQSASSGGPGVGQSPSDAESPNSRRGSEHNTSLHSVRSEGADADARLPHAPTGEFFFPPVVRLNFFRSDGKRDFFSLSFGSSLYFLRGVIVMLGGWTSSFRFFFLFYIVSSSLHVNMS